jgi:hypothetical protein
MIKLSIFYEQLALALVSLAPVGALKREWSQLSQRSKTNSKAAVENTPDNI